MPMILYCYALTGLQLMLDSCCATAVELNLQFNAKKSHCIAFGKLNHNVLRPMVLNNSTLAWVPLVKYLGVAYIWLVVENSHLTSTQLSGHFSWPAMQF